MKKFWIVLLIVALIGGGFFFYKSTAKKPIAYRENVVQRGNLSITTLATGSVLPQNRLEIKPPVAGRVDSVLVKEGQKVVKGQILAWMSSGERAALIDAARAQGPEEVKRWEELYKATPVIAPITGTIILRAVESGQTFTNSEAILVMSDRLTVKAQVDETDISQIKLKQAASITLDAYSSEKIPGRVEQIAFESKPVNNVTTYVVDVLPLETPSYMRAGMTANVSFVLEARENILLIPAEMIQTKTGKSSVLIPSEKGTPVSRDIEVGLSDGKNTEVLSGLVEGEKIIAVTVDLNDAKPSAINPFGGPSRPRTRSKTSGKSAH